MTETHNERAERIRSELAEHFKDVRELESRPQADGTFRRVFGLSAPTAIPYLLVTFERQTVDVKMHGKNLRGLLFAQRLYVGKPGDPMGMLAGLCAGVMNTRIDAESGAVTCLRAALRDGTPLAALIDERFPGAAPKADRLPVRLAWEDAPRRVAAIDRPHWGHDFAQTKHDATVMEWWIESHVSGGGFAGAFSNGKSPIPPPGFGPFQVVPHVVRDNPRPMTHGRLLAAARLCGLARVHTDPAPVEVPPSTMAELRRLGARPLCTVDDGARYDFDEVP